MNTGLLILYVLLQAADVYTTLTVLKQGGRELNPVLAKLFAKLRQWRIHAINVFFHAFIGHKISK